jgi:uncharacterized protein
MKVVLAGGSGFLGSALRRALEDEHYAVANLTRGPIEHSGDIEWTPDGTVGPWGAAVDGVDAVVNLAGANVATRRWTAARKAVLRSSRLLATRSLVAAIHAARKPPVAFISASGTGYYGDRGAEIVTEATSPGDDFLARLCVEWEAEAERAAAITRVAIVRSGLVLDPNGGALRAMLLPFRFGLGGPIASGRQYLPWIHLDDWIDLVRWLVVNPQAGGPFNATAPEPATNAEFTRTLARVLRRPAFVPVPGVGLRILLGELAEPLLTGQRALPARALEIGFEFSFGRLEQALDDLLG